MLEIFYFGTAVFSDPRSRLRWTELMPPERREKLGRMQGKALLGSLAAGAALYTAVKEVYGAELAYMRISAGPHGKPYFPDYKDIHFSLSHTDSEAMCAVSDTEVGCDIQRIVRANMELAKRHFHPEEYELLLSASENERDRLFTLIWAMKESYLKMTGDGIAAGLGSFCAVPYPRPRIKGKNCRVEIYERGENIAAVCRAGDHE